MSTPIISHSEEDNNNLTAKTLDQMHAKSFACWYRHTIDENRQNLGLYVSEDAKLEWFGRTIRTHKKIVSFLKHDMQCSKHEFSSVESINRITNRWEGSQRATVTSLNIDSTLATPLHNISSESLESQGIDRGEIKTSLNKKRPAVDSCDNSSEWIQRSSCCVLKTEYDKNKRKRTKTCHTESMEFESQGQEDIQQYDKLEINDKGDGCSKPMKEKSFPITPHNKELGQGDCLPSTSGTDSIVETPHINIYSTLPRRCVECNGYIEFTRSKNSRTTEVMKWNRKCKIQISYSMDPINIGNYVIWAIQYSDESKCRRNLLSAFEEVAREHRNDS